MRTRSIAAAAASVALLTVAARIAGFGRLFAFSQTVGDSCLGTVYQTANQVPNVLFEVVAGGALAGVLVPVLAARLASGDPAEIARASRTASAALTWSVTVLLVLAALTALTARPVLQLLLQGSSLADCGSDLIPTAVLMLWIFLPQVPLYAVAVVFAGVLQAQQRFTAPAAAPLVSSLVVATAYLVVGALVPAAVMQSGDLGAVPASALWVLAGGTTLGVLALAATHAPALRSAVRWRICWRPAPQDGPMLRALALAGVGVLLAQQVVAVLVTVVTNTGGVGAVNRWSYSWALFLLPYAVLAVPVATAVFPRFARSSGGDLAQLQELMARSARTVVLVSSLGAAVLAAVAAPVALVFVSSRVGSGQSADLRTALLVLAPGLLSYGLIAVLTRALYAGGGGRSAATATVTGWVVVGVLAVLLAGRLPVSSVVTAVAAAHTVGLSVGAGLLVRAVRSTHGRAATTGLARAVLAGALAAAAGGGVGAVLATLSPPAGTVLLQVGLGVLLAAVAAAVWLLVVRVLAASELAVLFGGVRRVLSRRPA